MTNATSVLFLALIRSEQRDTISTWGCEPRRARQKVGGRGGRLRSFDIFVCAASVAGSLSLFGCDDPNGVSYRYELKSPSGHKVARFLFSEEDQTVQHHLLEAQSTTVNVSYAALPIPLQTAKLDGQYFPLWSNDDNLVLALNTTSIPSAAVANPARFVTGQGLVKIRVIPYVPDPDRVKYRSTESFIDQDIKYSVEFKSISDQNIIGYCALDVRGSHFHIVDINKIERSPSRGGRDAFESVGGGTLFDIGQSLPSAERLSLTQAKVEGFDFAPIFPPNTLEFGKLATSGIGELLVKIPPNKLLNSFRSPEYKVVLGFGFDEKKIIISVRDPIPVARINEFQRCISRNINS